MKKVTLAIVMLMTSLPLFAQISGSVIDAETNDPLPGATVVVKGISIGISTGFDGTFTINAS